MNHEILPEKLCLCGVQDNDLSLLKSYLSWGLCCSVILFIIYMNDLQNVTENCDISMYANDTNVSSALIQASNINDELVSEFTKICHWLVTNKLSMNILKTEYMIIGTEQSSTQIGLRPVIFDEFKN